MFVCTVDPCSAMSVVFSTRHARHARHTRVGNDTTRALTGEVVRPGVAFSVAREQDSFTRLHAAHGEVDRRDELGLRQRRGGSLVRDLRLEYLAHQKPCLAAHAARSAVSRRARGKERKREAKGERECVPMGHARRIAFLTFFQ